MVTFYCPTLGMNCKKSFFFFTFSIVPHILCCLNVIFWWFGRIYWGEILIKYQKNLYFNKFGPKMWLFPPYLGHGLQKIIILFYFFNSFLHILLPTGVFWWFGRIYWVEILIKYQNNYILTILAPKWWPSSALV